MVKEWYGVTVSPLHEMTSSYQSSKALAQILQKGRWVHFCFIVVMKTVNFPTRGGFMAFRHLHSLVLVSMLKNERSRVLLFLSAVREQQHIFVFTTQPPPWDIFSRYLKKKTLWPWWTLWCPVALILLTEQQTASKPGLFSHQTNTHNLGCGAMYVAPKYLCLCEYFSTYWIYSFVYSFSIFLDYITHLLLSLKKVESFYDKGDKYM